MVDGAESKKAQIDAINEEMLRGRGPGSVPPSGIPAPSPSGNLQRALAELQRASQPPPSSVERAAPQVGLARPITMAPRPLVPRPSSEAPPRPSAMPLPISSPFGEPSPETRRFIEQPASVPPPAVSSTASLGELLSSNTQPHGTPVAMERPNVSFSAQPSTLSITSPMGSVVPGGKAPSVGAIRTPSPMAIVGTSSASSLRIASPGRSMTPQSASLPVSAPLSSQPPLSTPPEPPTSSSPHAFGAPSSSSRNPPRMDSQPPVRPSTQPRSFMPASALSRPPTASKSFAPAPYERAFRQWSSPNITEAPDEGAKGPVSFQVYTAQDVASGRGPMRSIAAVEVEPKKSNVAVRFLMVVVGLAIVALTAAAVYAVSTDDPKKPAPAVVTPAPQPTPTPTPRAPEPPPGPTVLTFGNDAPPSTTTTAAAPTVSAPAAPSAKKQAAPRQTPRGVVPSILAPPPNPYGK